MIKVYISSSPDSICLHADDDVAWGQPQGKTGSSAGHSRPQLAV